MAWWNNKADIEEEMKVVVQSPRKEETYRAEDDVDPGLKDANMGEIKVWLDKLKQKNVTKEALYTIYDKMAQDSIIAAALELIVDDVAQKDRLRHKRVWAEPNEDYDKNGDFDEDEASDVVNEFLREYKMDNKIKTYTYNLTKYGEVFLKTYKEEFENGRVPEQFKDRYGTIFEMPANMSDILALELYDTLVGFGVVKRNVDDKKATGYDFVGVDEYVHFCLDRKHTREKVNLKFKTNEGSPDRTEFKHIIPSSYLDGARSSWAVLDLIETLILYARFGHSDFFNLVKVEVGSAGRAESAKILRSIKRLFENQDALNIKEQTYSGYRKPIPKNANIFVATRQGKGDVTVEPVQPAADVKDIVDLNYWLDKLCAALRIPKAYLGLADDNMSGLGDGSLTKINVVYCRLITYIQDTMKDGVKEMCDYYLRTIGREDLIEKYQINMSSPVSAEDQDWREDMEARIQLADAISMFLQSIQGVDMSKISPVLLEKLVNIKEVAEELDHLEDYINTGDEGATPLDVSTPVTFGGQDDGTTSLNVDTPVRFNDERYR